MALALSTPFAPSSPAPSSRAAAAFPPRGVHFATAGRSGGVGLPLACAAPRSRGRRRRGGRMVVWAAADYYATLGVQRSANIKDIKAAYRKLARQLKMDELELVSYGAAHGLQEGVVIDVDLDDWLFIAELVICASYYV